MTIYVNAYHYERAYGGPEEGGWWYDVGTPVEGASVAVADPEDADVVRETMTMEFPHTGRSSSVLGGEDYLVLIEEHPPRAFPTERPHYE